MTQIIQTNLPLQFDAHAMQKRVGLVILATDHTTEPDFQRLVARDQIGIYVARIAYANPTTPANLRLMQPDLTAGASLILPDEELDAICYSCTSASVVIGDTAIESAIQQAKPNVPVITPTLAAVRALHALSAKRISILTPYTVETSTLMLDYFSQKGFDIARFTCLGLEDDRMMARISPESLIEAARLATAPDCDALFISCTAVRAAMVATQIEAAIGKPVVSSNLATTWATLRACGFHKPEPALGQLLAQPLAGW